MLSIHVKAVQTDGRTDNGKTIQNTPHPPPDFSIRGIKMGTKQAQAVNDSIISK